MQNPLPLRRTQQLSVQHVAQETLLYDEQTHKAFCLNPVAAAVWNRCDGQTTTASIAMAASLALDLPITEELVLLAVKDLGRDNLLQNVDSVPSASRREMVRKLGAGAALLLPVVAMILAPEAAQAYSGCVDC